MTATEDVVQVGHLNIPEELLAQRFPDLNADLDKLALLEDSARRGKSDTGRLNTILNENLPQIRILLRKFAYMMCLVESVAQSQGASGDDAIEGIDDFIALEEYERLSAFVGTAREFVASFLSPETQSMLPESVRQNLTKFNEEAKWAEEFLGELGEFFEPEAPDASGEVSTGDAKEDDDGDED